MRAGGLYVTPPNAERVPIGIAGAAETARRRTREIVKLWHWEQQNAPDREVKGLTQTMHENPIRDLAASCYLQGVNDAAEVMWRSGAELERPRARIIDW